MKSTMSRSKHKDPKLMLPIQTGFPGTDLLPADKFGTETEAEKQMKMFLEKQLDTKISLKDHFSQHRQFANSSTFKSLTELIHGECTLEKFKEIENAEEKRQELQRSGLNEDEINFYMKAQSNEPIKETGFPIDPRIIDEKLEQIKEKVIAHEKELQKPETFKNVKTLSRHEMEIEKTLYVGCNSKMQISTLISEKTVLPLSDNDPFKQVQELSEKLAHKLHKKHKNKHNRNRNTPTDLSSASECSEKEFRYDPNIHHVIIPLGDEEVARKRLHLDEIKQSPRFENYEPGVPNKVLFLKNLHPKANIHELRAIFGRFESENLEPIQYRILSGRMKGQVFLTFPSVEIAEKALTFANGYVLRGRPMIIQYGREKSTQKISDAQS